MKFTWKCVISPKPQKVQNPKTWQNDNEKQQILSFKRLEPANLWHFCFKNDYRRWAQHQTYCMCVNMCIYVLVMTIYVHMWPHIYCMTRTWPCCPVYYNCWKRNQEIWDSEVWKEAKIILQPAGETSKLSRFQELIRGITALVWPDKWKWIFVTTVFHNVVMRWRFQKPNEKDTTVCSPWVSGQLFRVGYEMKKTSSKCRINVVFLRQHGFRMLCVWMRQEGWIVHQSLGRAVHSHPEQ